MLMIDAAPKTQQLARIGNLLLAGMLVLLPFHGFLTTWLGSETGWVDGIRLWKEGILILAGLLALVIVLADRTRRWRSLFSRTPLLWLLGFSCLTLFFAVLTYMNSTVTSEAIGYGVIIHLRLAAAGLLTAFFSRYDGWLYQHWRRLILLPAVIVVGFGLLQVFVLPHDFLERFGYGPSTIPAFQTIDNKLEFQRIQSTLRGANPFGAYLVVVISALLPLLYQARRHYKAMSLLVAAVVTLYFTYSRSAWAAALIAATLFGLLVSKRWRNTKVLLAGLMVVVVMITGVWVLRDNDFVQNTVFHSDETSASVVSSNTQRGNALTRSVDDIVKEPLGGGVGSAGPASFRNEEGRPRVAENYFIQVGQEFGWVGLAIILGLMTSVGRALWRWRANELGLTLFVSFIGLTLVNVVSHAWTDDTLSVLWWTLFGALIGHVILNEERTKHHEKKTKTRS